MSAYVANRIACLCERIQETERLMRPPTPQELLGFRQVLKRLKEQEAHLTHILATAQTLGLFDP